MTKKRTARLLIPSALAAVFHTYTTRLLLRNLGALLAFDGQFSAIFAQTAGAQMRSPTVLVFLLAWGLFALLQRCCRRWVKALLGAGGLIVLWVLMLRLTQVNGVAFGDVLLSLVPVLMSGVL